MLGFQPQAADADWAGRYGQALEGTLSCLYCMLLDVIAWLQLVSLCAAPVSLQCQHVLGKARDSLTSCSASGCLV